jgi:inositol phosphorylceramide mannosyltransferase catalytic subunit
MPDRIPKRIIHVFCAPPGEDSRLPLLYEAARVNTMALNPDFEHLLFDGEKIDCFVKTQFPEYQEVFASFPFPIQRFDFFRYLAIYRLGGFYMDLDVFLAHGLKSLLRFSCVFPFEELTLNRFLRKHHRMDWEIGNYAFGAERGHPFIKLVIDNCVRAKENPSWGFQMLKGIPRPFQRQYIAPNTTGPGLISRTLAEHPEVHSSVTILFPDDVCDPRTWHRFGQFGVHLMNSSWRGRDGIIRARLASLWALWSRRHFMRDSERIGASRPGEWNTQCSGFEMDE